MARDRTWLAECALAPLAGIGAVLLVSNAYVGVAASLAFLSLFVGLPDLGRLAAARQRLWWPRRRERFSSSATDLMLLSQHEP